MSSKILFYKFPVNSQVFYKSKFTYALVNLKPIVPGHVLVVPLRVVPRLKDLTPEESVDYINTIQLIHSFIESYYKADSLNISMQDGVASGQSIPHVHTHIIPRFLKDGFKDEIYQILEKNELNLNSDYLKKVMEPMAIQEDDDRLPRSMEAMEDEAQSLSTALNEFILKK